MCRSLFYVNSAANPIIYNAMSSKFRVALFRLLGVSSSPTSRLLRRRSTLTTTSSTLSTSSLRRRASSILIHGTIDVFNRRNSIRTLFNKRRESSSDKNQKTEYSSGSRRVSDMSYTRSNETLSRQESEVCSRKSSHASQISSRKNSELYKEFREVPIIKEDDFFLDQNSKDCDPNDKPPPSPISLLSASSSHQSTPPSSPLYTLINNGQPDNCSRSSSVATPETSKKVSFSETVFHWDHDENHVKIPLEEHKLHTWRTYAMFSRRSKLKNNELQVPKSGSYSFKEELCSNQHKK